MYFYTDTGSRYVVAIPLEQGLFFNQNLFDYLCNIHVAIPLEQGLFFN